MFSKIGVWQKFRNKKTPVLDSLFYKVAGLRSATSWKRDSNTGVFLWILRTVLRGFENTSGVCFCQFDKVTVQYWASAGLLFLIKNNRGRFLLKRFVDLLRLFSLHIIKRNHSNTFLFINLQKTKTLKHCNKGYLFWYAHFDRFRQVFIYQESLENSPSLLLAQKKNKPENVLSSQQITEL